MTDEQPTPTLRTRQGQAATHLLPPPTRILSRIRRRQRNDAATNLEEARGGREARPGRLQLGAAPAHRAAACRGFERLDLCELVPQYLDGGCGWMAAGVSHV